MFESTGPIGGEVDSQQPLLCRLQATFYFIHCRFDFHFYPRPGTAEGLLMMVRQSLNVERVVQQQLGGSWSRIGLHALVSFKGLELQVGRG